MTFLKDYLSTVANDEIRKTVEDTVERFSQQVLKDFDYKSRQNGLLLGEVQSGKTGQMLGIIADAADKGFELFILLTSSNNYLQHQTYLRTFNSLKSRSGATRCGFCVCNEMHTVEFQENKMHQPVILVLKKDTSLLRKWRNELLNSDFLKGRSVFILDDEADAASPDTNVNRKNKSPSAINKHIKAIRDAGSSCIYLQVTATPQAVLLQTIDSQFRPQFVTDFKPGKNYLGGNFFFAKPESYSIRCTPDDELPDLQDENADIILGLATATLNYLIVVAQNKITQASPCCNFLVHPSTRIKDHRLAEDKIRRFFNDLRQSIEEEDKTTLNTLKAEWQDLFKTKPEIENFDRIIEIIKDILHNMEIHPWVINSQSGEKAEFQKGNNILIGGEALSRGVTIPYLQTVYYSRTARVPQADTFWQHCRMFGYDRDRSSVRIFMPGFTHKLFQELNNSQQVLTKELIEHGLDDTHLIYIGGVRPTRPNVIKNTKLFTIAGGVNYFSAFPVNNTVNDLDKLLTPYANNGLKDCSVQVILDVLSHLKSDRDDDWAAQKFIHAVKTVADKNKLKMAKILVSTDRKISKGTGTMLSPNDRELTDKYANDIVLVMYKLTGKEGGWDIAPWNGQPFWMPNIKLPKDLVLWKVE